MGPLLAPLSGARASAAAAADAAAAANPAAASGLSGCWDAAARTRRAAHARLAIVDRVRMLLEHTHTPFRRSEGLTTAISRVCVSLEACYEMTTLRRWIEGEWDCLSWIGTVFFKYPCRGCIRVVSIAREISGATLFHSFIVFD